MRTQESWHTVEDATRQAFDSIAATYDDEFGTLPATERLRGIVGGILLAYFTPGQHILELNCGTGTDALFLARHGVHVHAVDLSPRMIEKAREKIGREQLPGTITLEVLSFDKLHTLRGRQFDGAFSNMGGLNCTRNLAGVADGLHAVIRPGGWFVPVVMTDFALLETLAFLVRGKIRKAFRRSQTEGCLANLHGGTVRTFYHSPASITRAFGESFTPVLRMGLNIFTPSPSSANAYRILGGARRLLEALDNAVCRIPPFNRVGDHCLLVFQRKGAA